MPSNMMNNGLETMCKKTIVTKLGVLSGYLLVRLRKIHCKLKNSRSAK
jgi:uncharacterized membrane protein